MVNKTISLQKMAWPSKTATIRTDMRQWPRSTYVTVTVQVNEHKVDQK